MTRQVVKHNHDHPVARIVNKLRQDLQDEGYAYGALFLANRKTGDIGIYMPEEMPVPVRVEMLKEMADAVQHALKAFTI